MAFINVKKVELEDTNDPIEAFADTLLLCTSIVHDCIERKEYDSALHHLRMIDCGVYNLSEIIKLYRSKDETISI